MSTISGVNSSSDAWAAVSAKRTEHREKMFAKVDTDGNGSVNQAELDTLVSDISQKTGVSLGDSKELFSKMDTNADGNLSSDELGEGMKQLLPPPPTTMDFAQSRGPGGPGGPGGANDDLFSKVDSNSDGSVDATELKAFTDKIQSDTGGDVTDKFSQLDTDGDAKLSKAEFEAGRPQGPEASSGTDSAQAAGRSGGPRGPGGPGGAQAADTTTYDPLDTDQDGTVSELERLAGALKELAASDTGDGTASPAQSEIARLAQKLYDQISANFLDQTSETSLSAKA